MNFKQPQQASILRMLLNKDIEYLSFAESNAIKGILILLIIFGHCHYIAPNEPVQSLQFRYVYLFHVICFFILPFFYKANNKLSFEKIRDTFVRFFVPYFIFFILCSLIFLSTKTGFSSFNTGKSIFAFVNGSEKLLKDACGFTFLWFLPAFFIFSILKQWFLNNVTHYSGKKHIVIAIIVVVIVSLIVVISWNIRTQLSAIVPFAIVPALCFFGIAVVTFYASRVKYLKYVGAVVFVVLSILFFASKGQIKFPPIVFPASAFMFLLIIKNILVKIPFLQEIGKMSFVIYMVHVIIYNVLEQIFDYSAINAIITFILTICMSIVTTLIINKITFIRKLVFPKGYDDIKTIFKKDE